MMLSNKMKRITLLMYIMMRPKIVPTITSTAMRLAKRAASIPERGGPIEGVEVPACGGKRKPDPLNPPEPSSPASSPTMASRVHWPNRKGRKSCCLVCSIARGIASTAEIAKVHLVLRKTYSKLLRLAQPIKSLDPAKNKLVVNLIRIAEPRQDPVSKRAMPVPGH